MIRFGSRADVYLPQGVEIKVKKGDRVVGGETLLGKFPS
jgi:phosphatidylserine decarboxylase